MKEESVLYQLKSLEKTIAKKFCGDNDSRCSTIKMSTTQHLIMVYIIKHRSEVIYQKDLEKVLNLSRATVSGVLQTMEKNKLVKRVTDTVDTRTKVITLTEEAKKTFDENELKFKEIENAATNNLTREEVELFKTVIAKMKTNIKSYKQ